MDSLPYIYIYIVHGARTCDQLHYALAEIKNNLAMHVGWGGVQTHCIIILLIYAIVFEHLGHVNNLDMN